MLLLILVVSGQIHPSSLFPIHTSRITAPHHLESMKAQMQRVFNASTNKKPDAMKQSGQARNNQTTNKRTQ